MVELLLLDWIGVTSMSLILLRSLALLAAVGVPVCPLFAEGSDVASVQRSVTDQCNFPSDVRTIADFEGLPADVRTDLLRRQPQFGSDPITTMDDSPSLTASSANRFLTAVVNRHDTWVIVYTHGEDRKSVV